MKPIDAKTARRSAQAKGFMEPVAKDGKKKRSDHYYFFYHDQQNRKTTWRINISHGATEMAPGHIRRAAMHCNINRDDMFKILNCTHDKAWVDKHYLDSQRQQAPTS